MNLYVLPHQLFDLKVKDVTTSNFILEMTDFEKDGKWNSYWDELYRNFIKIIL